MLDARNFGVKTADEFYKKYVSQGRWTRCLECMHKASIEPSKSSRPHLPWTTMAERGDARLNRSGALDWKFD